MAAQDIILNDVDDLDISTGDFVVSESDQQHLALIVNLFEGSIKEFPLQGVGILQYSGSDGQAQKLQRAIKTKVEADGYQNAEVTLKQEDGDFYYWVDATRNYGN